MAVYETQKWWINIFAKTLDKKACMPKSKVMGDEYFMFVYGEILYRLLQDFVIHISIETNIELHELK